jgi:hypothetical protein
MAPIQFFGPASDVMVMLFETDRTTSLDVVFEILYPSTSDYHPGGVRFNQGMLQGIF